MSGKKTPKTVTTTQQQAPPDFAQPFFRSLLGDSAALAQREFIPFTGERVAGFTPEQIVAQQMVTQRALAGNPQLDAANANAQQTLNGGFFRQTGSNPFLGAQTNVGSNSNFSNVGAGNNEFIGRTTDIGNPNQFIGRTTDVGTSRFAGDNPFLNDLIQGSLGDITRNFQGNAAGIGSQFAKAGAFGGSAQLQATDDANRALAEQLSRTTTGIRSADFDNQRQIEEAALNRSVQAQQNDLARNAGLEESGIDRRVQTQLADLARNGQLRDSDLGRQLNAAQFNVSTNTGITENALNRSLQAQQADLARNSGLAESFFNRDQNAFDSERNRQLSTASLLPQLEALGFAGADRLAGIGDARQRLNQQQLDVDFNAFNGAQNFQADQLQLLANALGIINGGFGNQTATQPNPNAGGGGVSGLLGGAAAGSSIGSQFGGPGAAIGGGIGGLLGLFGG